jgi:hypothetical protein
MLHNTITLQSIYVIESISFIFNNKNYSKFNDSRHGIKNASPQFPLTFDFLIFIEFLNYEVFKIQ